MSDSPKLTLVYFWWEPRPAQTPGYRLPSGKTCTYRNEAFQSQSCTCPTKSPENKVWDKSDNFSLPHVPCAPSTRARQVQECGAWEGSSGQQGRGLPSDPTPLANRSEATAALAASLDSVSPGLTDWLWVQLVDPAVPNILRHGGERAAKGAQSPRTKGLAPTGAPWGMPGCHRE